jgi:hypothetical protein
METVVKCRELPLMPAQSVSADSTSKIDKLCGVRRSIRRFAYPTCLVAAVPAEERDTVALHQSPGSRLDITEPAVDC